MYVIFECSLCRNFYLNLHFSILMQIESTSKKISCQSQIFLNSIPKFIFNIFEDNQISNKFDRFSIIYLIKCLKHVFDNSTVKQTLHDIKHIKSYQKFYILNKFGSVVADLIKIHHVIKFVFYTS